LADELSPPGASRAGLWPVDKVVLSYFAICVVLIVVWWRSLPQAPWLLAGHALLTGILFFQIHVPNPTSWVFRNWYPTVYVSLCYREMSILVPAIRHTHADRWLADLDFRIWHANPTIWLERIYNPVLTEYLQIVYTLFVPAVILVYIPDCNWIPGVLFGLSAGPRARPTVPAKALGTRVPERAVAVSSFAIDPRPIGIGRLRLFPQRTHRIDHPGLVGYSSDLQAGVLHLFCLHTFHHVCHGLSAISLHG